MKAAGGGGSMPGMKLFVVTRTLRQEDHPDVTLDDDPERLVAELRSRPGKDVWLFGGGALFRSLAQRGLVDTVEVAVIPGADRDRTASRLTLAAADGTICRAREGRHSTCARAHDALLSQCSRAL
jgi:dihydrofolate reductase